MYQSSLLYMNHNQDIPYPKFYLWHLSYLTTKLAIFKRIEKIKTKNTKANRDFLFNRKTTCHSHECQV